MNRLFYLSLALFISVFTIHAQTINPNEAELYQKGKVYCKVNPILLGNAQPDVKGVLNVNDLAFMAEANRSATVRIASLPFYRTKATVLHSILEIEVADPNKVDELINSLENTEGVEYAERVPLGKIAYSPNDPLYPNPGMWHLAKINASSAWNISKGNPNIIVAIIDNAVNPDHPDLSAAMWRNSNEISGNGIDDDQNGYVDDVIGWDFADDDNDPAPPILTDPFSGWEHGTHCAGLAGAVSDNNLGIPSIGFNITVMPLKGTSDNSNPSTVTDVLLGVIYAADNGAHVISMSWTAPPGIAIKAVMDYAYNKGCVLLAAAGNTAGNATLYPASYDNVLSVSMTNVNDQVAETGSTYGPAVGICAPGASVLSTVSSGTGYELGGGTSMATPFAAGLCGLMLSVNPNVSPADIVNCLQATADNIDAQNPGLSGLIGSGRINANAALIGIQQYLNYPPVAEFTSNTIEIVEGGTINFTDNSNYGPTSWQWNFGDGTAISSLQNPSHIYTSAGIYTVSLTVANTNGTDSDTKTAYILVNPLAVCDTIANYSTTDTLTVYIAPSGNGYLAGHNGYGNRAYAEYFDSYQPYSLIGGATYTIYAEQPGQPSSRVKAIIWDEVGGKPGNIIGSQDILVSDIINSNYLVDITYDPPIQIPGNFFMGIEIYYTQGEVVSFVTTQANAVSINSAWLKASPSQGGQWYDFETTFGAKLSLAVQPHLAEIAPIASFTQSSGIVCEGMFVDYDATGSQDVNSYFWSFPGGSPSSSTSPNATVFYANQGTYAATLTTLGGCSQDVATTMVQVDVCTEIHTWDEDVFRIVAFDKEKNQIIAEVNQSENMITQVTIINQLGAVIDTEVIDGQGVGVYTFDTHDLAHGIYMVHLENESSYSQKVIVY